MRRSRPCGATLDVGGDQRRCCGPRLDRMSQSVCRGEARPGGPAANSTPRRQRRWHATSRQYGEPGIFRRRWSRGPRIGRWSFTLSVSKNPETTATAITAGRYRRSTGRRRPRRDGNGGAVSALAWSATLQRRVRPGLVGNERIAFAMDCPDPASLALAVPDLLAQPGNMNVNCPRAYFRLRIPHIV